MIIVRIIGGLGNQMFQYAAGYALSKKNKTSLLLDTNAFKNKKIHNGFELNSVFNIEAEIATDKKIKDLIGWRNLEFIKDRINRLPKFLIGKNFFSERLNLNYSLIKDNTYLYGYWQSEKFFLDYKNHILQQFQFKKSLSLKNKNLAQLINETQNSVSIHIRRGDYLKSKAHYVIGIEYFKHAILEIERKIDKPTFFVFSDDPNWTKKNLSLKKRIFMVENNLGSESHNDMLLMSMCDHHIISNSSFSWWGAWLNVKKNKIVISPKRWFVKIENLDCVPKEWIKL